MCLIIALPCRCPNYKCATCNSLEDHFWPDNSLPSVRHRHLGLDPLETKSESPFSPGFGAGGSSFSFGHIVDFLLRVGKAPLSLTGGGGHARELKEKEKERERSGCCPLALAGQVGSSVPMRNVRGAPPLPSAS